jgi:hypothetical protein
LAGVESMIHSVNFVVIGKPRTKKNSQIPCYIGGKNTPRRLTILPSKAHEEWYANAMSQVFRIRGEVMMECFLPINRPVSISALWYLEKNIGDATGYYQALADWLQVPNPRSKKGSAGIIQNDRQIQHWDGSRLLKDAEHPRIEVTIHLL